MPEITQMIAPRANLTVEGVPPIPADLARRAGRYGEFRMANFLDWHPQRQELLMSTRFGDTAQVHAVAAPGGARRQLTFEADTIRGASYQPGDGAYLVYSKDAGGNEFAQNFRYDLGTGDSTLLTDGESQNSLGVWSSAGTQMAYTSIRRTGVDRDIYVIKPCDPSTDSQIAALEGGGWGVSDWSPDDQTLLITEFVSIAESYLWLLNVSDGSKSRLTPGPTQDKVSYGGGKFHPDGRSIFVTTDKDSEFMRLTRLDIATGAHTCFTGHLEWDVEEFDLSGDGGLIAFVSNEEGMGVLHLLDAATGQERDLPPLPSGTIGGIAFHPLTDTLAFTVISAQSPSDIFSLNIETGQIDRWTYSETGSVNTSAWREPQLVRWNSFDGHSISGFLYRPPARFSGPRPVMIVIHGGPESQFRPTYLARSNYYLNELGVALLFPNVRGSSGFGKTFLTLDNGFRREDSYQDITYLLQWIGEQADLDAERIMVTGGSYGGHMTLAVATRDSAHIRCALSVVGMSNLVTFLENTEGYRRDLRRVEYGDERDPEMRTFLENIAPINHAGEITKPLFIVQGRNDPRVPYTEALQMMETVRGTGTPVWFLMADDEGHGFIKKPNADFQFFATIMFVQQFLLSAD